MPNARFCNTAPKYSCFSPAYEPSTQTYYLLVYNQAAATITLYYGPSPANFQNTVIVSTGTASATVNFLRAVPTSVTMNSTSWTIPFWYTDQTSSPFNIKYGILVGPGAGGPGPSQPPTGGNQPVGFSFNTVNVILPLLGNVTLHVFE